MKKMILAAAAALALLACVPFAGTQVSAAEKLPDFTDDFESYSADGKWIENNASLTQKWDNNVFRGGEAVGMDAHIKEVGKIEYESGESGNKVLHLKNTVGADSFFYMGPAGDYRVKNFAVTFNVKFLVDGVPEKSWMGISFRKKANVYYTGTNNLLFTVQREKNSDAVTGVGYAIQDGGEARPITALTETYGEKLEVTSTPYTVAGAAAEEDMPWVNYKLVAEGNRYTISVNDTEVFGCTFDVPLYDYFGYLSLNCCTSNILVDDFRLEIKDEQLPPEVLPLATPVVTLNEEKERLEWAPVENAETYLVDNGVTQTTVFLNNYSLKKLKDGEYTFTVKALPAETFFYRESAASAPITYTKGKAATTGGGGCGSTVGFAVGGTVAIVCSALAVLVKRK